MNSQQKLTALVHELQHARSPLAQARVLARAWRTVRELGPTDRRLLARHAGFEGAEDILEGLSAREGGLAPAMLLRVLANARGTDGSTVSELLAAVRDPQRRDEAISLGADLASELLADPEADDDPEEIVEAIEDLQAVEEPIIETPEEALAALNALEPDPDRETEIEEIPVSESVSSSTPEIDDARKVDPEPVLPEDPDLPPPPPPPMVDWSRWHSATEGRRPAPAPREAVRPAVADSGARRIEARAVMGAMGAEQSVFSQLRVLRRELSRFAESSTDTLRDLMETFPDGWARRRALCALLENGIPADARNALALVSCLGREFDRRWCLFFLARKGDLSGANLSRALEMVGSEFSKRRLAAIAG
jgi:hypothetical protein